MFFELDWDPSHFVDEFALRLALPRGFSVEQFVDHDADGPDVVLDGVDVPLEGLGGHVERAPHVVFLLLE